MNLSEHINELIEVMKSEECYSKNVLIALLEIKKQEICAELLKVDEE